MVYSTVLNQSFFIFHSFLEEGATCKAYKPRQASGVHQVIAISKSDLTSLNKRAKKQLHRATANNLQRVRNKKGDGYSPNAHPDQV